MEDDKRQIAEGCLTSEQWEDSQKNELWFWQTQKKDNLEQYHRNDYYRGPLEDGSDIAQEFFLRDFSDKLVIDVGSGPQGILHVLKAGRKIAIDPLMDKFIEQGYEVNANDVETLSMTGESFVLDEPADIALCLNAIDHAKSPKDVIKNIYMNLKIGGDLLLITDLRTPDKLDCYHKLQITEEDVNSWMLSDGDEYMGLEIIEWHNFPHQPGNPLRQLIIQCRK